MSFAIGVGLRLATSGCGCAAFAAALLRVMPTAERLEIIEVVGAAERVRLDVVDLIRRLAAWNAARITGLAAVAVASEDADASELPVGREFVTAL